MWQSIRSGAAGIAGAAAVVLMLACWMGAPARAEASRTETSRTETSRTETSRTETWRIDTRDGTRKAIVLPARAEPAPTVIVLHGAVNSAGWAAWRFGFKEAAATRGFAAAFPQGIGLRWNDSRGDAGHGVDDVAFLRRLAVDLVERGVAVPNRIYVAGISNGGMMALRLVCEDADFIAGIGTVIASMPAAAGAECRPARPVPVVMFNGTADRLVPYGGGRVGLLNLGGLVWGAERTAAFLADANRCRSEPFGEDRVFGRLEVTRLRWTGCARNATVTLYRMNGVGHTVPGRRRVLSGQYRHELSAAETILATFAGE
jgi:polyhydroxybutyrate depolymerase